jgi:hypothetical protein
MTVDNIRLELSALMARNLQKLTANDNQGK